uniref:Titin n=1 Tax=Oreochromis niloticus TaxID=8128 RepID=A0A669BF81_ORENI
MAVNHSGRSIPKESKPIVVKDSTSLPEFDLRGVCHKTVIAKAGDDIKVEIPVMGRPRPTVSWQKDGAALKLTQRTNVETTAASEPILALDPVDPPGQPVPISVNKNAITIQWTKPEYDGGFKITGYIVEKRELPAGRWMRANFTNIIETTFTVSGLTQDASYEFRIIARNSAGAVSIPSEPSDPIICKDDIIEPRIMVDAIFRDVVLLKAGESFKLEADIAGQPTPSMVWTKNGKEVENTMKLEVRFTELTTTLTNKDSIRPDGGEFILTATNVGGFAKHIFNVKVLDRPGPPVGPLKVTDVTAENCALSWAPPADDGGSKIEGYVIEKRESRDGEPVERAIIDSTTSYTSLIIENVNRFDSGKYNLTVENSSGSKTVTVQVRVLDTPSAPQNLKITAVPYIARPKATVSWVKDGLPLKRTSRVNFGATDTMLNLTIKEATKDDVGHYIITLTNTAGETKADIGIVVLDKPGQPGGPVKVEEVTSDSVTISWNPPEYDGGCTIKNYIVEKRDTSTTTWMVVSSNLARTKIKGNEYIFRVRAVNQYGVGAPLESPPVIIKDPYMLPGSPKNLEAPSEDGGSPVTGYIIEKHDKEGVRWTRCNRQTVTDLSFKVKGLLESHNYEFRVAAENSVGVGEPSSPTVFYKALDPIFRPGPPHNPRVTDTTRTSVFLSWGKPISDGGCEIQGYIVECCSTTFRVCAINKVGVGEHADVAGIVVAKDRADEPDLDIDPELRKIVTIKAGASLRLFIPIKGRPTPTIKWDKDEASLKETAQVEITSSYTLLVIDKMSR